MRRLRVTLAVAALVAMGVPAARGQDGGRRGATVEVEVRRDVSLLDAGTPVTGAWVASVTDGEGPAEAEARAVATSADGRALVDVPTGGTMALVWTEDRAPHALWLGRGAPLPVSLDAPRSLEVRVVSPTGGPVRDALVRTSVRLAAGGAPPLGREFHTYEITGRTDAHGALRLEGLPAGALVVRGDADGFVPSAAYVAQPGAGELRLTLLRGALLSGKARAVPGGGPAAGVTLSVGGRAVKVAEDGRFAIDGIPAGRHALEVSGASLLLEASQSFVLAEGERREELLLTLIRAATLAGKIVGPGGEPRGDVQLVLRWPFDRAPVEGAVREFPAATAEDGVFVLTDLLPCEGLVVEVRAAGHPPRVLTSLSLRAGERLELGTVVLEQGATLTGRVASSDAAAVVGAQVQARRVGDARERPPLSVAATAEDGTFLLAGLPAEPIRLRVVPDPAVGDLPGEFGPFAPGAEEPQDTGVLELVAGHTLRGRVRGAPRGARLSVRDAQGEEREIVLEEGVFEVPGLPAGDVQLQCSAEGITGGAEGHAVVPSAWPLTLRWMAGRRVEGRLVRRGGGPVQEAELVARRLAPGETGDPRDEEDAAPEELRFGVRDPLGIFVIELTEGAWRLVARSGALRGTIDVEVGAGPVAAGAIAMRHGELVRGEIASARDGTPLEGAVVEVVPLSEHGGARVAVATDRNGTFAARGVAPGVVRLHVSAPGHAPFRTQPLSVERAAVLDVGRVEIPAGLLVVGLVTAPGGVPARGLPVLLAHDDGHEWEASTDLFGRFEIAGVPSGGAVLEVRGRAQRVELSPFRDEIEVHVDLGAGTALQGTVLSDARPEAFAAVTAWTLEGEVVLATARTDVLGRFRLPPLPPGRLGVEVLTAGSEDPWETTIDLPAGGVETRELLLPAGSVNGQVLLGRDGEPAVGAFVWLWEVDDDGTPLAVRGRTVSGPGGAFRVERVAEGRYVVEAYRDGRGSVVSQPVSTSRERAAEGLTLVLPEEAALRVAVEDPGGHPLAGAWIAAEPFGPGRTPVRLRAHAGAGGAVRLAGLAAGAWQVSVGAPGRGRVDLGIVELVGGTHDLGSVQLQPGGALRVEVLHPGYFPAGNVAIRVQDVMRRDPRPRAATAEPLRPRDPLRRTGPDGLLLVPELSPGLYRVGLAGDDQDLHVLLRISAGEVVDVLLWAPWPGAE